MITIENYSVYSSDTSKQLVNQLNLTLKKGEFHLILGPNGAGKSSLLQSIFNLSQYKTEGTIRLNKTPITGVSTDEISKMGLFLGFQTPVEVPGLKNIDFLRLAYNKRQIADEQLDPWSFADLLETFVTKLRLPQDTPQRGLNEGFSGGEKRKFEILQMLLLEPEYLFLDEVDSGLDIDAQQQIFNAINEYYTEKKPAILLISHSTKLLEYINPTHVHLMKDGELTQSGGVELANQIMTQGYASTNI